MGSEWRENYCNDLHGQSVPITCPRQTRGPGRKSTHIQNGWSSYFIWTTRQQVWNRSKTDNWLKYNIKCSRPTPVPLGVSLVEEGGFNHRKMRLVWWNLFHKRRFSNQGLWQSFPRTIGSPSLWQRDPRHWDYDQSEWNRLALRPNNHTGHRENHWYVLNKTGPARKSTHIQNGWSSYFIWTTRQQKQLSHINLDQPRHFCTFMVTVASRSRVFYFIYLVFIIHMYMFLTICASGSISYLR